MQPEAGSLLIASAKLMDPNFARCVLLVLDSDDGGTLGVVLNQPSQTPVGEVLEPWQHLTTEPGVFFRGGPVEQNAALGLAALRPGVEAPPGYRPLPGSSTPLGIVDLDSPPDDLLGLITALRVYAGYAGWGSGQLEDEIDEGSWHVVPSTATDRFSSTPELLRGQVLRRQPTPLSFLATLPEDVSLN